jgi:hypothetical protein
LERLPSLEYDELPGASAADLLMSPHYPIGDLLQGGAGGGLHGGYGGYQNQAGMLLSHSNRGNSFELAASGVSAPLMQHQTSFDGSLFSPKTSFNSREVGGNSAGRVELLPDSPPMRNGIAASSSSAAGMPLRRQQTVHAELPPTGRFSVGRERGDKRKSGELGELGTFSPPSSVAVETLSRLTLLQDGKSKKLKILEIEPHTERAESKELLSLASEGTEGTEGVDSSMHEAHTFMDLLNRNQQVGYRYCLMYSSIAL